MLPPVHIDGRNRSGDGRRLGRTAASRRRQPRKKNPNPAFHPVRKADFGPSGATTRPVKIVTIAPIPPGSVPDVAKPACYFPAWFKPG